MTSERTIPRAPLWLGLGGLIPFVGLAILAVTGSASRFGVSSETARAALLAYGAIIASFLGGIRWGLALRESGRAAAFDLALSVVPSLIAWACLALPRPFDAGVLGLLLLAWGAVDQDLPRRGLAPAWFGRLRIILSGVAGPAMWVAATFGPQAQIRTMPAASNDPSFDTTAIFSHKGLHHDHAIERVVVGDPEQARDARVTSRDWELSDALLGNQRLEFLSKESGLRQLSLAEFCRDLPGECSADEDFVLIGRDGLTSHAGQVIASQKQPDQGMRIEQKPHSSAPAR